MDKHQKSLGLSLVLSLVTVFIILGSLFVLSGNFSKLVTTIVRPKASSANPKITQAYVDNFKTGVIDKNKWTIQSVADAKVAETSTDNLRFDIPAGSQNNERKSSQLLYNQLIKDKGDFRFDVVAYRPIVTGPGTGMEGIRFNSTGTANDEGAVVRWLVDGTSSKIQFIVADSTGKARLNVSKDVNTNIAIFRLTRVNSEYRAFYKVGNDISSDTNWIALGDCDNTNDCNKSMGQDGHIALFAHNTGTDKKFPKVVARFDMMRLGWEGAPAPTPSTNGFSDAFSGGNLGSKWRSTQTSGVSVAEAKKNLAIVIPGGGNVARRGSVKRVDPIVGVEKNFQYSAQMFRPAIVGDGTGFSNMTFASSSVADKEAASIRWYVTKSGKNTSYRLAFIVNDRNGGTPVEQSSVVVTDPKITAQLRRSNNKYTAWYRVGDADADWKQIGNVAADNTLGEDGNLYLGASNVGTNKKFPYITAQFDVVSGNIEK